MFHGKNASLYAGTIIGCGNQLWDFSLGSKSIGIFKAYPSYLCISRDLEPVISGQFVPCKWDLRWQPSALGSEKLHKRVALKVNLGPFSFNVTVKNHTLELIFVFSGSSRVEDSNRANIVIVREGLEGQGTSKAPPLNC